MIHVMNRSPLGLQLCRMNSKAGQRPTRLLQQHYLPM